MPFNWRDEFPFEKRIIAQQIRVDELHLGPEVTQGVFDGGARKRNPVFAPQIVHRVENFAFAVFDLLAFIQDDVFKLHLPQQFLVAQGSLVSGQNHIKTPQQADIGIAPLAYMFVNAEGRCEFFDLGFPVEHQRSWQDNQGIERLQKLLISGTGGKQIQLIACSCRIRGCGFLFLGIQEH